MVTLAAGPMGVWPPGEELDVPDEVGIVLVEGGYAVPVRPEHQRAVIAAAEVRDADVVDADGRSRRRTRKFG